MQSSIRAQPQVKPFVVMITYACRQTKVWKYTLQNSTILLWPASPVVILAGKILVAGFTKGAQLLATEFGR